uniref:Sulfotransferase domain-containing protein n=1 Tax=Alexandrium andersonii TaxID=327968 RepID=A0A7S2GI93_9DINO
MTAVLEQPPAQQSNCALGKVFPEFFLIGMKNTGTSSLSQDLRHRGVFAAPDDMHKEWQFFMTRPTHGHPTEMTMFKEWIEALPDCPEDGERKIVADFSVTTSFAEALPNDFVWSPKYGYPAKSTGDVSCWGSAAYISHFYGNASMPAPKFMVLLRDPLERLQSEWYHTRKKLNCLGCDLANNFSASLAGNIELMKKTPPEMSDWLWKNYYSRQVESFLEQFDSSHFAFIPDKEYIAGKDPVAFSRSLLSWLDIKAEPWSQATHRNEHSARPPLDEELPPSSQVRKDYEALMAPELDRLAKTLADAQLKGAWLTMYDGPKGDVAQIRDWLVNHW